MVIGKGYPIAMAPKLTLSITLRGLAIAAPRYSGPSPLIQLALPIASTLFVCRESGTEN